MANFENITIEKGMYQTKGGISGALEKLDPSENYRGTALEGLDAFSRQLKRFDIKVKGRNSDCVEKFFRVQTLRHFSRICEQSCYAGHGESGYSPESCGDRDRH